MQQNIFKELDKLTIEHKIKQKTLWFEDAPDFVYWAHSYFKLSEQKI